MVVVAFFTVGDAFLGHGSNLDVISGAVWIIDMDVEGSNKRGRVKSSDGVRQLEGRTGLHLDITRPSHKICVG